MTQQINLYQPLFLKQKKQFSARAVFQATAVILVGIAAIYGYMQWQVGSLRVALKQANLQHAQVAESLAEFKSQFVRVEDKRLVAQINRLEEELAIRTQLFEVLQSGLFSNLRGYSEYFTAFARQHIPGIWLTGFEITGAGEAMTLHGRATIPELVPRYLHRLSAEATMAGIEFKVFEISRPEVKSAAGPGQSAGYIEFLARTTTQTKPVAP